jgi:hypothetical protein
MWLRFLVSGLVWRLKWSGPRSWNRVSASWSKVPNDDEDGTPAGDDGAFLAPPLG